MIAWESRSGWVRWLASGLVVLIAHGGAAVAMLHWSEAREPNDPAAAMVIELAPMPTAIAKLPAEDVPPGPEQVQADASVSRPAEKVQEQPEQKEVTEEPQERQPEISQAENPEIAIAAQPPKPAGKAPAPDVNNTAAPATTAPQLPKAEEAAMTAAPTQGPLNTSDSNAIPSWRRQIVTRLERHKRYPAAAQSRHEHGTAQLAFRLDRQGRVIESHIVRSSGSSVLDQETLEIVRRAQPFPPIPTELAGPHVDLTVPIRFNLR
jgi:protein TonB